MLVTFSKAVYFLIHKYTILSFKCHIIFQEWDTVHSKKMSSTLNNAVVYKKEKQKQTPAI